MFTDRHKLSQVKQHVGTCVFGDVLQQQGVFGEPLHLDGDDVLKLQSATQPVTLRFLKSNKMKWVRWRPGSRTCFNRQKWCRSHGKRSQRGRDSETLNEFPESSSLPATLTKKVTLVAIFLQNVKRALSTWMKEAKRESFFCLVLMISRAKGWLLQKVPTACLIFSSSPPPNCDHATRDRTEQRR